MPKLTWDQTGERKYLTGVSKGVIFPYAEDKYGAGVAWNGLTKVSENPSGAEPTALWADNGKYLNILSAETFAATVSAYMYPDEFKKCIGEEEVVAGMSVGQQEHQMFGFSYQTIIGNDTKNTAYGYQIHVVYGCTAAASKKDYETVNDSPSAAEMSFDLSTTPVDVTGFKPTATIVFDSTKLSTTQMKAVEDALYGTAQAESKLPSPDEFKTLIQQAAA